ncbi:MAG: hypothetical protein HC826_00780 [Rhodospirillales bacterium]|nr:hypothetical protein [Rhodospirillales bacterium]
MTLAACRPPTPGQISARTALEEALDQCDQGPTGQRAFCINTAKQQYRTAIAEEKVRIREERAQAAAAPSEDAAVSDAPADAATEVGSLTPAEPLPPPGEKLLRATDDPALLKSCVNYQRRYLWIDQVEVSPIQVNPDSQLNHRFIYTFCPQVEIASVIGTLVTRIYYQGQVVVTHTEKDFPLSPGQWAVDANILIPAQASPGIYTLETSFVAGGAAFNRSATFSVL